MNLMIIFSLSFGARSPIQQFGVHAIAVSTELDATALDSPHPRDGAFLSKSSDGLSHSLEGFADCFEFPGREEKSASEFLLLSLERRRAQRWTGNR